LATSGAVKPTAQALVAFNNASATDSVRLVENFARALLKGRVEAAAGSSDSRLFDTLLRAMPAVGAMAERAAQAAGVEFTPPPAETLRRARESYAGKLLLVKFEKDDLDQCTELLAAVAGGAARGGGPPPTLLERPGNHLSPVCLRLGAEALNGVGGIAPSLAGRLGELRVGDEGAAAQLGRDLGGFLQTAAMARA